MLNTIKYVIKFNGKEHTLKLIIHDFKQTKNKYITSVSFSLSALLLSDQMQDNANLHHINKFNDHSNNQIHVLTFSLTKILQCIPVVDTNGKLGTIHTIQYLVIDIHKSKI